MKEQIEYYHKRASEYEAIYAKPERQKDLIELKRFLQSTFSNQRIIEIACGTGYWTEVIAKEATSIFATDINQAVLEIAKSKQYPKDKVRFQAIDLNKLSIPPSLYDRLFGGFIWSHIPRQELQDFIHHCFKQIKPTGHLVFIDNKYVEGNSTPISKKDEFGNTFQKRTLQNGDTFEIIKNFPNQKEIQTLLNVNFEWIELDYFWILNISKRVK